MLHRVEPDTLMPLANSALHLNLLRTVYPARKPYFNQGQVNLLAHHIIERQSFTHESPEV